MRVVAAREGDPVDVDGNGLFDDNRYYNSFGNDDVILLDDNTIQFVCTLKSSPTSTTSVEQGYFKLRPTMASCTFRNGSGINPAEYECWSLPIMGKTWNTKITTNLDTIATYQIIASAPMPAFPIFGGELLINPANHFIVTGLGGGLQAIAIPNVPALNGGTLATQGLRLDAPGGMPTLKLLNALDIVIRP